MVVREQKLDGADQTSMDSQSSSTSIRSEEEEDSSGGSDQYNTPNSTHRKRKATDQDEDREMKRQKNREAAKRCRDKKQKQTEDLKRTNGELEKENCQLSKQRDDLIRKCKQYQKEIDQHRQHGCTLPFFKPPYNLDHLLQPSNPPSPSFSESAPSTSSCASPAPSISPGPPASDHVHNHAPDLVRVNRSSAGTSLPASTTSGGMTHVTPDSRRQHYLRVRRKDGNYQILALDNENYVKVMSRLKAQRAAAAKTSQAESMPVRTPEPATSLNAQPQEVAFQQEEEPQSNMNTEMITSSSFSSQAQEQEASHKSEQKLDTTEDLLSILKTHVKDTGHGYELVPIKKELLDTEYEQNGFVNADGQTGMTGIKQENVTAPESSRTWTSTGQHIRKGLDTLANQDDSRCIQDIVQFLESDEHSVPVTIKDASTVQQPMQTVRQSAASQISSSRPAEMVRYVTSSAPMAALSKRNVSSNLTSSVLQQSTSRQASSQVVTTTQPQNGVPDVLRQRQDVVLPSMQNVKLRPRTAALVTSSSTSPVGMPETASLTASSALASHQTVQETAAQTAGQTGRTSVTSTSSVTSGTLLQPVTNTSVGAESVKTSPAAGLITTSMPRVPGQQPGTAPSVQTLQRDAAVPFQPPASSTIDPSAIAALRLHTAAASTDNLLSESTSQIAEYLKTSSLEMFDS